MARSECEEFTAAGWWPLIEWLAGQLHRRLAQLRRDRRAFAEAAPFLFHGRAPGLECVGSVHHNDRHRPHAWVLVDVRLGKPAGHNEYGRTLWEREFTLEARLPEAHQRKIVQDTDWRCSDAPWHFEDNLLPGMAPEGRLPRARVAPLALQKQLRARAKRRLRDDVWRPPLTPPCVWIDPYGETNEEPTPHDVTKMALLLIFWQEGMVKFGPVESPDAWAWVKTWTRTRDTGRCWEVLDTMRRDYVRSEDWRGLRIYLGKVIGRLKKSRGDALNYTTPLRDEGDGAEDDRVRRRSRRRSAFDIGLSQQDEFIGAEDGGREVV